MNRLIALSMLILLSGLGCDTSDPGDGEEMCLAELEEFESEIRSDLDDIDTDTDFTLLIQSDDGKSFSHSTGNSSESRQYESASTSKLVTAVVILDLVHQGILSLTDHP